MLADSNTIVSAVSTYYIMLTIPPNFRSPIAFIVTIDLTACPLDRPHAAIAIADL